MKSVFLVKVGLIVFLTKFLAGLTNGVKCRFYFLYFNFHNLFMGV